MYGTKPRKIDRWLVFQTLYIYIYNTYIMPVSHIFIVPEYTNFELLWVPAKY
jgi:hypothetical protein